MVIIAYCILVVAWFMMPRSGFVGELENILLEHFLTDEDDFGMLCELCFSVYKSLRNYLKI